MSEQKPFEEWIASQEDLKGSPDISVIIPAYNEQLRLPPTLIDIIDYFDQRGSEYEVLVVDDGSSDNTAQVGRKFSRVRPQVRTLRVPRNSGKGYAVRTGVLNAQGKRVLFADADGATPIEELERLEKALNDGASGAFGSRAMFHEETSVKTRFYRKYIGRIFNLLVNFLVLPDVKDTQCGFKLFSAETAQFLFENQTSDGFSFDVEILLIARLAGIPLKEVPVNWTNIPGSKVNLITDSWKMFLDLIRFRVRHRNINPESFSAFLSQKNE